MSELVLGLDTFGDITVDPATGERLGHPRVIRNIIDEAVLADRVGIDAFGIGEHHRADFAVSAPDIVLSAIAARTKTITVGTAVTVLSSDDPVRVYERFATLDAVSNGRAEVTLGRGSFTESFPLFGFDLTQYEKLFEEKLELFSLLLDEGPVTWNGTVRAPLTDQQVYPKTESGRLKAWVGVGGSPESVIRSVRYGIPMALAIIGGNAGRFAPYVDLYKRAQEQFGREPMPSKIATDQLPVVDQYDGTSLEQRPHRLEAVAEIGTEHLQHGERRDHDDRAGHGVVVLRQALLDRIAHHDEQHQVDRRKRRQLAPSHCAHHQDDEQVEHDRANRDVHRASYGTSVIVRLSVAISTPSLLTVTV